MKPLILLTYLLMFSLQLDAGNDKGNGGFVIQCALNGTVRTEVLDLYEARWVRNLQMKDFHHEDPFEIAIAAARRLKAQSPRRAARYEEQIRNFHEKARFVSNAIWTDVGDYGPIFIPQNCAVIPAAIQKRFSIEEEPTFFINQEMWNSLAIVDQAALVLHEVIYLEFAHDTSVLTRSFVGLLFSHEFDNYVGQQKFLEMLTKMGAPTYEYGVFDINIRNGYIATNDTFVRAHIVPGVFDEGTVKIPYRAQRVDFYQNGNPKALLLQGTASVTYPVRCFGMMRLSPESDIPVRFFKSGRLQKASYNAELSVMDTTGCHGVRYVIRHSVETGWFEIDQDAEIVEHSGIDEIGF
jgi:hypothetical protein